MKKTHTCHNNNIFVNKLENKIKKDHNRKRLSPMNKNGIFLSKEIGFLFRKLKNLNKDAI